MKHSAAAFTAWSTAARGLRILLKSRLPLGHAFSAERFRCGYFALVFDFLSSISEILCRICERAFVLRLDYERFRRLLVPFAFQAHFVGPLHFAPGLGPSNQRPIAFSRNFAVMTRWTRLIAPKTCQSGRSAFRVRTRVADTDG